MTDTDGLSTTQEAPQDFNIFFQNMKIAPTAPKQEELSTKHTLPEEIFFYLHLSNYPVDYPLPREYPEHKYLHRAAIYSGHEAAGPAIQLQFNPSTVIGLKAHHMKRGRCDGQLCLRVPVTRKVNPFLAPKQLVFQPSTACQLHSSQHLPRIIVPVMPLGMHSHGGAFTPTLIRNTKKLALKALVSPWEDTPRGQRLWISMKRWKRVCDEIYAEAEKKETKSNTKTSISDATVGTPFRFGTWFPRAALDVPPYTTIYFQNGRIAITAPKPKHMPTKHLLPKDVYFYVRTMTADVVFPKDFFPTPSRRTPPFLADKYLHVARVLPGHEAGGPAAHMVWNVDTVVGLQKHHCLASGAPPSSMQLMIVIPSTPTINPGIEETQLAFSPTNFAQLHLSRRLPRIIVPLFPRTSYNEVTRYVDAIKSGEKLKKLRSLLGAWETFANKEVKLAGFKRWSKVVAGLGSVSGRKVYVPPEPQIGSPFVELLKDKGTSTDRARWPRLERAAHMWGTLEDSAENRLDKLLGKGHDGQQVETDVRRPRPQSPRTQSPRRPFPGRSLSPAAVSANLPAIDVMAAQAIQNEAWGGSRPLPLPGSDASATSAPRRAPSPPASARRHREPLKAEPSSVSAREAQHKEAPLSRGYPWTQEKSQAQRRMEELLKLHAAPPYSEATAYRDAPPYGESTAYRDQGMPRSASAPKMAHLNLPKDMPHMRGTLTSSIPRTPRGAKPGDEGHGTPRLTPRST